MQLIGLFSTALEGLSQEFEPQLEIIQDTQLETQQEIEPEGKLEGGLEAKPEKHLETKSDGNLDRKQACKSINEALILNWIESTESSRA